MAANVANGNTGTVSKSGLPNKVSLMGQFIFDGVMNHSSLLLGNTSLSFKTIAFAKNDLISLPILSSKLLKRGLLELGLFACQLQYTLQSAFLGRKTESGTTFDSQFFDVCHQKPKLRALLIIKTIEFSGWGDRLFPKFDW